MGNAVAELAKSVDAGKGHFTDESDLGRFSTAQQAVAEKMTTLVKGAGYNVIDKTHRLGALPDANQPLSDPDKIFTKAMKANQLWTKAHRDGVSDGQSVIKSLSPEFMGRFGAFAAGNPMSMAMNQWAANLQQQLGSALDKNISLTAPLATGFVPFNLAAPSRLIYPVYSPFRNKLARTQGQGASYRAKVVTGVSGSQTGASGGQFKDIAIPEFQGGGNFGNWPLNLPGSGTQDSTDINVPYKFLGLTESVSWLAQFSGQGYEDVSALANLILLQEMMLNEEAQIIAATSTALAAPGAPTLAARAANSGESGLTGVTTTVYVKVTAANYFGETAASAQGSVAAANGQVVDVVIPTVPGALWYNLYVTTGAAPGTFFVMQTQVGGNHFTLQGALPVAGTAAPGADTGTFSTNRFEGLVSTLSGHSAGGVYPAGWKGGYVNQAVGAPLGINVVNTALEGLWSGPGAYRADPAELVGEGSDISNLSDSIVQSGTTTNYRLFVEAVDTPGVRAGAAVSEFVNPITRSIVRIMVHPWLPQGSAMYMSYTLPFSWSNVSNVWEMNMVQDYLSIGWPVIDATFRFSMFEYGALVANAPFYCGLQQGIQRSAVSGSTGTWS